jgi:uncharacterized protein
MLYVKTILKESPIHGLGLFAAEPIMKDTLIWEFNPLFDKKIYDGILSMLPTLVQEFIKTYGFLDPSGYWILCSDNARFMNHSDNPTCKDKNQILDYAAKDIEAGEELTCNYYVFDRSANHRNIK